MTSRPVPIEVFYCSADADEQLLNELEKHLGLLRHEGLITTWHKRHIPAGADWTEAIDSHLNTAHHPYLAACLHNLAKLYHALGKYEKAEPLYERAFAIREQQLGLQHPDTLTTGENYTQLLQTIGQQEKARQLKARIAHLSRE